MTERDEQLARIAHGWDLAVDGYDAYYVPRFAPWVDVAVQAVTATSLPAGPVLVPCCGTFPELPALVEGFPDQEIVGIDLSDGMVRRARERAADHPHVRAAQGDASTLDREWEERCAAVVSVFGLQQLPDPVTAIESWAGALRQGGRLSVVYWPAHTEDEGPFALMDRLRGKAEAGADWERELVPALEASGNVVEKDTGLAFTMTHASATEFVDAHIQSGPLRAVAQERGDDFITELRAEFLREAPAGEWRHRPRARHLVVRR